MNEGEKERKEGGDKEIRKNVYGGRRKKQKNPERASWRRWRENGSAGTCVEKKKKRGGHRNNVCGGGDSIGGKKKNQKQKQKRMGVTKVLKKEII